MSNQEAYNPRCWPESLADMTGWIGSDPAAATGYKAVCHCGEWEETGFETVDEATAAFGEHRGEPQVPEQRAAGGTDATGS